MRTKLYSGNIKRINNSPGRTIRKWEDNIKSYLKEVRCDDVDWVHLGQDRTGSLIINLRFLLITSNFLTRPLLHEVS
jgi:hypothetical protein